MEIATSVEKRLIVNTAIGVWDKASLSTGRRRIIVKTTVSSQKYAIDLPVKENRRAPS